KLQRTQETFNLERAERQRLEREVEARGEEAASSQREGREAVRAAHAEAEELRRQLNLERRAADEQAHAAKEQRTQLLAERLDFEAFRANAESQLRLSEE